MDCIPVQQKTFTVFEMIADGGGIAQSQYYPYNGAYNNSCYFNLTIPAIQTYGLGFQFISGEPNLKQSIFDNGPAVATFNVASDFVNYKDGIYSSDACAKGDIQFQHNLLIIGWGTDATPTGPVDYWIAQNSWGIGWGQAGYAKIIYG